MVDEMMSDEERGEELKRWLRENGAVLVTGVVLGLGGLFGWQGWQGYRETQLETAADKFQAATAAIARGDTQAVARVADDLLDKYPGSPYGAQALFAVAKLHVESGELEQAAKVLRDAIAASNDPGIAEVGRTRLARVLLSDDRAADALAALEGNTPSAPFAAQHYELYGDALRASGRPEEARTAYGDAIGALTAAASPAMRNSLELKLASLGPVPGFDESAGADAPAMDDQDDAATDEEL